jgi:hypothetical protein
LDTQQGRLDGVVDEMANIYPHFALAVSQPFLVLSHLAHLLAVCPLLHVLHLNLDGSRRRDRVVTGSSLKDERSDDEGDDDDDDDDDDESASKKKKRS